MQAYADKGFGFENFRATLPTNTRLRLDEFFRGDVNEDQLIETCQSDGMDDLGFVNLCIGMKLIGERKLEKALGCLRDAASESRDPWSGQIARALLGRLEVDETWPYGQEAEQTD